MTVTVPERNRAIKKLLEATYGKGCVSVRAGDGTAYRWVEIKFSVMPAALYGLSYARRCDAVENLIRNAEIELSTFNDDCGQGTCLSLTMPREVQS